MTPHDVFRTVLHGHGTGEPGGRAVLTGRHAALYNRIAAGLVLGPLYRAVAARLAEAAPQRGSVLDVGTGPGRLLVEIARRRPDLRVVGVDPSQDMVRHAQDRARSTGLADRIEVHAAPAEMLPFPDDSFDVVTSTLSAHHWSDVTKAVLEQTRVLRLGGHLFVYDLRGGSATAVMTALHTRFPDTAIDRPRLGRPAAALIVCHRATKGDATG